MVFKNVNGDDSPKETSDFFSANSADTYTFFNTPIDQTATPSPCHQPRPRRRRCLSAEAVPHQHAPLTYSPSIAHQLEIKVERSQTAPLAHADDLFAPYVDADQRLQSVLSPSADLEQLAQQCISLPEGLNETLVTLLKRSPPHSPLLAVARMIALSNVARTAGNKQCRREALTEYVTALRRIHRALADPVEAHGDDVLMAVLMLGFYEVSCLRCQE